MEKNGRNSCTGNSRHVHIRFFFIKSQVDDGKLQIVYCPTGEMLADYFTKPLQGRLFHLFRAVIMGWAHIDTLKSSSTPKERVENMGISDDVTTVDDVTKTPITYAQAVRASGDATKTPMTSYANMPVEHLSCSQNPTPRATRSTSVEMKKE